MTAPNPTINLTGNKILDVLPRGEGELLVLTSTPALLTVNFDGTLVKQVTLDIDRRILTGALDGRRWALLTAGDSASGYKLLAGDTAVEQTMYALGSPGMTLQSGDLPRSLSSVGHEWVVVEPRFPFRMHWLPFAGTALRRSVPDMSPDTIMQTFAGSSPEAW